MPAKKKSGVWLLPPAPDDVYERPDGGGFRFVYRSEAGRNEPSETFATRSEAIKEKRLAQSAIDGKCEITVKEALEGYEKHLCADLGYAAKRAADMIWRLQQLLTDNDELLEALTTRRCEALYDALRARRQPRTVVACGKAGRAAEGHPVGAKGCLCRGYAVDSHRNMLAVGRMFMKWCVGKEYVKTNCLAGVKGVGRRKKGKAQLAGVDQSRRFLRTAHQYATVKGEQGAVAAMFALLMGLRASLIVSLRRDMFDCDGTVLVVTEEHLATVTGVKSLASVGRRDLHPELVPYVQALLLMAGPGHDAPLWSTSHWRDWVRKWVARICRAAEVRVVSAHGMRGTFVSLGYDQAADAATAQAIGHESFERMTGPVYMSGEAITRRNQRRAWKLLEGGKKGEAEPTS